MTNTDTQTLTYRPSVSLLQYNFALLSLGLGNNANTSSDCDTGFCGAAVEAII